MKLLHPEIVLLSKGNFFTSVCSRFILKSLGSVFKKKLPHPEMLPLSKGNFFTIVCSGVILKLPGGAF